MRGWSDSPNRTPPTASSRSARRRNTGEHAALTHPLHTLNPNPDATLDATLNATAPSSDLTLPTATSRPASSRSTHEHQRHASSSNRRANRDSTYLHNILSTLVPLPSPQITTREPPPSQPQLYSRSRCSHSRRTHGGQEHKQLRRTQRSHHNRSCRLSPNHNTVPQVVSECRSTADNRGSPANTKRGIAT